MPKGLWFILQLQQLYNQWHVVTQHLVGGRGVGPGKVEGVGVVLEEEGLVVDHLVAFAEDAPNAVAGRRGAIVPLVLLLAGEFVDEGLVNDKVLAAIGTGGLVFVGPEAWDEKECHLEVGIAQQGRESQA